MELICRRNKGELIKDSTGNLYLDQLSVNDNIWIDKSKWGNYLKNNYRINMQSYLSIIGLNNEQIKILQNSRRKHKDVSNEKTYVNLTENIDKYNLSCSHYPGKIVMKEGGTCATNSYYLDQLSEEIKYIRLTYFKKYLKQTYGITYAEYYNIVIFGDINKKHYCVVCGNETHFIKLSRGYSSTCCTRCHNKLAIDKAIKNPHYVEHHVNSMLSWNSLARSEMNRFISVTNSPTANFYLVINENNDKLKFGITKNSIDKRINYYGCYSFPFKISCIEVLISNTPKFVAELEYYIKCKYKDIGEIKPISELSNIKAYIQEFLNNN